MTTRDPRRPAVSLCVTCRGRLHHLRLTLPGKLVAAARHGGEVVVLDYNCPDGTGDWVRAHHAADLAAGRRGGWRTTASRPPRTSGWPTPRTSPPCWPAAGSS